MIMFIEVVLLLSPTQSLLFHNVTNHLKGSDFLGGVLSSTKSYALS